MGINKKELEEFKNKIAVKKEVESPIHGSKDEIWVTKDRGDYISLVGSTENETFELLYKYGITENIFSTFGQGDPINVGYSPSDNKWYGWSHRAIFGFTEGSKCKLGNVQFSPSNKEEFKKDLYNFWAEDVDVKSVEIEETKEYDEEKGSTVEGVVLSIMNNNGFGHESFYEYPETWGKGEWTAKTMEDAKEMAIDFAENIS